MCMNSFIIYHLFSYVIHVFSLPLHAGYGSGPFFLRQQNNSSQMNVIQKLFVSLWRDWLL